MLACEDVFHECSGVEDRDRGVHEGDCISGDFSEACSTKRSRKLFLRKNRVEILRICEDKVPIFPFKVVVVTKPTPYSHSPHFSDHFAYHIVFLCCHMTVRLMSDLQTQRALHHMTFALHHMTVRLIIVLRCAHIFSLFHSTPIKLFAYSFFGNILSTSL